MRIRRIVAVSGIAAALAAAGSLVAPASADIIPPLPDTITQCQIDEGWLYVDGEGYVHVAENPSSLGIVYCYF